MPDVRDLSPRRDLDSLVSGQDMNLNARSQLLCLWSG
jgi:hypothetical protein